MTRLCDSEPTLEERTREERCDADSAAISCLLVGAATSGGMYLGLHDNVIVENALPLGIAGVLSIGAYLGYKTLRRSIGNFFKERFIVTVYIMIFQSFNGVHQIR